MICLLIYLFFKICLNGWTPFSGNFFLHLSAIIKDCSNNTKDAKGCALKNNKKAEYNEGGKMNGRLTVVEVSYKCVNLLNCIWRKKRSLPLQMTQFCFEFKWIQSVYACHEGDKNKAVMVWSQQTPGYVVLWLTGGHHRCPLWPHKGLFWEVSVSGLKGGLSQTGTV